MKSIFKTLFLSLCIIANTHFAYAQTASILPQGKTQFTDNNGKPLASGTVDFYIPSTTTRKTTWQNSGETISNTNPVVLDGGGRAIIYGDGNYRMVVKDRLGNLIYDQLTSSTGTGSSAPTATGDGDLVGTIKPWAGMTAPSQYLFTYGQEVSRTTYAALYTAITSTQPVFCNSGSPTLTSVGDTTNFWIGMSLEVSCVVAGFSTVVSKTASSVTMAANANVSTNTTATFFPFGRGNGSTTFNLPDLRGVVLAGNNNMGGVASSNLTTAYFGTTNPNSIGALGGAQNNQLSNTNIPSLVSTNASQLVLSVTSADNVQKNGVSNVALGSGANGFGWTAVPTIGTLTSTGTVANNQFGTYTQTSGGSAISALIGAVGSGYTPGSQTITVSGGTCTTQPQFTVTVSGGGAFSGIPALLTAGSCTIAPSNPASTTGGGGTGGTLNILYTGNPISIIPPTKTTNYIIKVTPDTNSATASGVTSLGSMTGDIACGSGLLCTGNIISVSSANLTVNSTTITSGTNTRILYDNNGLLGEYATVPLANGGTNNSNTASNGGIIWSDASKFNVLSGTATANLPLLSGSTATPSWATISYPTSATSGGIPYFNSTSSISTSALLAANQIVLGGGAGAAPSTLGSLGTTTTVLHGNAAGAPSYGAVSLTADVSGTLPLGNGGTGQTTALAARASSGLNVDQMTTHGDSIYTILSTDRTVATSAAFTASRTWTLPAANSINAGQELKIVDLAGGVTGVNTLVIARAGADTINGGTSVTISNASGGYLLISDGTSKWSAQAIGSTVASGVSSIAGNTGAFTLGTGLTNSGNDLRVSLPTASNILGADVNLNNTANYFDGPSMAQGTSGTWFASGTVTVNDTAAANTYCKLWDGTTVISSTSTFTPGSGGSSNTLSLHGFLTSPAANIRISCRDTTNTTGKILFNITGNSKDSSIFGIRLAP